MCAKLHWVNTALGDFPLCAAPRPLPARQAHVRVNSGGWGWTPGTGPCGARPPTPAPEPQRPSPHQAKAGRTPPSHTSQARAACSGSRFSRRAWTRMPRGRSPYLRATRPHLVWCFFGHAAADPGHARHLPTAVHGPLSSRTPHAIDSAPAALRPPPPCGRQAR